MLSSGSYAIADEIIGKLSTGIAGVRDHVPQYLRALGLSASVCEYLGASLS
jgi:hypothetical protein